MSGSTSWKQRLRRFLPPLIGFGLLIGIGYLLEVVIREPEGVEETLQTIPPLPQHSHIKVYFNQSRESAYTDPYRGIHRYGYDLEAMIIEQIRSARSTVDIAVQEINLPLIAQALADQHQAGVKVRFITENTYNIDWSEVDPDSLDGHSRGKLDEYYHLVDLDGNGSLSPSEIEQRDVYTILRKAGVPYVDDTSDGTKGSGLMHQKFIVIDGQRLVTGSNNFTLSGNHGDFGEDGSTGNVNHLMVIDSPEISELFTREFNYMWGDGPGGQDNGLFGVQKPERPIETIPIQDAVVSVHFSPAGAAVPYEDTTNGAIVQALSQARESIDLALFVFSDQGIVDELKRLQLEHGVEVRGVFDPGFAYRDFSRTLDMWGLSLPRNCEVDPARIAWDPPSTLVGVPNMYETDKLHHKAGLIDSGTPNATVITGSHNWSAAANKSNDESILVIESTVVAAHFTRELDRLFENSRMGPSRSLQDKVAVAQEECRKIASGEYVPEEIDPASQVNLNTASQDELESLPGIGPTLAQNIINARPINSLEDFDNVSGIGPTKLADLERLVRW